ncbi:unnamed protein product [Lampetra planeri]
MGDSVKSAQAQHKKDELTFETTATVNLITSHKFKIVSYAPTAPPKHHALKGAAGWKLEQGSSSSSTNGEAPCDVATVSWDATTTTNVENSKYDNDDDDDDDENNNRTRTTKYRQPKQAQPADRHAEPAAAAGAWLEMKAAANEGRTGGLASPPPVSSAREAHQSPAASEEAPSWERRAGTRGAAPTTKAEISGPPPPD